LSGIRSVVVVGGGIGGLCSALWLAGRGCEVTVLESDDTSMPETVGEAWRSWDRGGAPQVRQPHIIMARICSLLRQHHPQVYDTLLGEGATEVRFVDGITDDTADYQPEPGDGELTVVRSRRTTMEWVLRRAAQANEHVRFCSGTTVAGLVAQPGHIPHVTGVRLAGGSVVHADLTVIAGGKRTKLPAWYTEIGAREMPQESGESGVVYVSRYYRLPTGRDFDRSREVVVTGGFLQGGVFEADNRTFSASVVLPREDTELRRLLLEPGRFEHLLKNLPPYDAYADLTPEPISDVAVMAGVTNRWRDVVVEGEPLATGVVPVGDAVMCTNPVYGRGMSTAAWMVDMFAAALDRHGDDPAALVTTYAAAVERELKPWYLDSCHRDEANRRYAEAVLTRQSSPPPDLEVSRLLALMKYDAVVQRAFMRTMNLLSPPTAMLEDTEVMRRLGELAQRHPDAGTSDSKQPERGDLIALLTACRNDNEEALTR
jgi:2-polyprenyl-6-methoxyphenol hydroxylase-like FAD-dependent oxidoreductase